MKLKIRTATPDDIPTLLALDPFARTDEIRRDDIRNWVERGEAFVAIQNGSIAGYAVLEHSFFHQGFLALLMVAETHRRLGVGTALVSHAESICMTNKLFTSTNRSNQPMQGLLAKLEFVYSGEVDNLDDGDPERFYCKRIGQ